MRLRGLLSLGIVVVLVALAWLAVDWWWALPPDAMARADYVGSARCAECHEKETRLWHGSDHQRAMARADARGESDWIVFGDFGGVEFLHFAFEDVASLDDAALGRLVEDAPLDQWARALADRTPGVEAKIERVRRRLEGALSEPARRELAALLQWHGSARPCDATTAQAAIVRRVRALVARGDVKLDGAEFSRLFRRDGKHYVTTDGPGGRWQTFEVAYTFGVRPLQQYLVPLGEGRVQCLPIAWDTERGEWFHLYPGERIRADDPLHWTRPLQNWNYMCAECHSTDLRKNYDAASNTYRTTFFEINVGCEACHGPGSVHAELSDSWSVFWDRRHGYALPRLKGVEAREEIESCAPCHARRQVIYPGFRPGARFLDHYVPELLDNELYYPDGQILEEDYEYVAFLQSKMYAKGVRCTDCHDAHTARVKTADPAGPWRQPIDNALCTGCHMGAHPAAKYDTPAHHHHPDATKGGTRCVECHAPETTYMVVDPRRDHGFRNPRPDLSRALGVPNACNLCHHDPAKGETPEWAEAVQRQWYPERAEPPHFAHAIAAGRRGEPAAESALDAVARRKDLSAVVRASAVALLGQYGTPGARAACRRALGDDEPLVRLAAVRSMRDLAPDELSGLLAPLLADPLRAVRAEAARLLSTVPENMMSARHRRLFRAALGEYLDGQLFLADQPAARLNLAVVAANRGDMAGALAEYEAALRLDPTFVPARINRAMLYDQMDRKAEAAEELRAVIRQEPGLAEAHYSLGLLLAERPEQLEEAARCLAEAVRLAPLNARMHYNYGLALQHLGRPDEAERELAKAVELRPVENDFVYALVVLDVQQGRWQRAEAGARELLRRQPRSAEWQALLDHIRRRSAGAP